MLEFRDVDRWEIHASLDILLGNDHKQDLPQLVSYYSMCDYHHSEQRLDAMRRRRNRANGMP